VAFIFSLLVDNCLFRSTVYYTYDVQQTAARTRVNCSTYIRCYEILSEILNSLLSVFTVRLDLSNISRNQTFYSAVEKYWSNFSRMPIAPTRWRYSFPIPCG